MSSYERTPQTTLLRIPARGTYDRSAVHAILDEAFVCHLGFVADGRPFVIPTTFARDDETLYVHGAAASRTLRAMATGLRVCVNITLLDGLVLARSWFHHSMNYRSVVVFGEAHETDRDEKLRALSLFIEKVGPGRPALARAPSDKELNATTVLALPLVEVSAKVRDGGPIEEGGDIERRIWAGHVPLRVHAHDGVPAEDRTAIYAGPWPATAPIAFRRER